MRFRSKNKKDIRIASTTGHVILVGQEWVTVPEHMERDAYASGCISEEMYETMLNMNAPEDSDQGEELPHDPANPDKDRDATAKVVDPAPKSAHETMLESQALTVKAMINKMVDEPQVCDFTERGTPNLKVLSDKCEFTVSKAVMEPIWEEIQKERDNEEG